MHFINHSLIYFFFFSVSGEFIANLIQDFNSDPIKKEVIDFVMVYSNFGKVFRITKIQLQDERLLFVIFSRGKSTVIACGKRKIDILWTNMYVRRF